MATLQLGEEVAHALIRNLAGNDNIPDRNSIRGGRQAYGWVGSNSVHRDGGREGRLIPKADVGHPRSARNCTCDPALLLAWRGIPRGWGYRYRQGVRVRG